MARYRAQFRGEEMLREDGYWYPASFLREMFRIGEALFFTDREWAELTGEEVGA